MDQIILRYRFVPDAAAMPDISDFREPIIIRARFEADTDHPASSATQAIPTEHE